MFTCHDCHTFTHYFSQWCVVFRIVIPTPCIHQYRRYIFTIPITTTITTITATTAIVTATSSIVSIVSIAISVISANEGVIDVYGEALSVELDVHDKGLFVHRHFHRSHLTWSKQANKNR